MTSSVTADFLLQGASYALEQCGLLLRDANILCRSGSYSSAVALAAFAREELGRSTILRDLWREIRAGKKFPLDEVQRRCEDHVTKQQKGMLSTVLSANRDSGLGKILQARLESHPESAEWKKADEAQTQMIEAMKKRVPSDRHKRRMAALYVEPVSEHHWNRPATEISARVSHEFLQNAVNDYAGRYHQGYITSADSILKHIDAELYSALEQWSDRPTLQPPEWPILPVI